MWHSLPANTPLYRASRAEDSWESVLRGNGAFYTSGGRYNVAGQATVYASPDPLVALCEFAWHAIGTVTRTLSGADKRTAPLTTTGQLWQFSFGKELILADVTHPRAGHEIGFASHVPWNPHSVSYPACQEFANALRIHRVRRPEGLLAPSVRTPSVGDYRPQQVVLFVLNAPDVVPESLEQRGNLLNRWSVEYEFLSADTDSPANVSDLHVAWSRPRVRLGENAKAVPKYVPRPKAKPFASNKWHALDIQYSPY